MDKIIDDFIKNGYKLFDTCNIDGRADAFLQKKVKATNGIKIMYVINIFIYHKLGPLNGSHIICEVQLYRGVRWFDIRFLVSEAKEAERLVEEFWFKMGMGYDQCNN